jgi:hypothetical protein
MTTDNRPQSVDEFIAKIRAQEGNLAIDLSSGEDLSIAVMNLISIEEHLFFSAQKTGNDAFLSLLTDVRDIRKKMLAQLLPPHPTGETWCISKHLLAASMRLMETGTKLQGQQPTKAANFYAESYNCYNLFWLFALDLIKAPAKTVHQLTAEGTTSAANTVAIPLDENPPTSAEITSNDGLPPAADAPSDGACRWRRYKDALKSELNCCHE